MTRLAGGCSLLKRERKDQVAKSFCSRITTLEFVFHNIVERPVDNYVDNAGKSVMVRLLDRIA